MWSGGATAWVGDVRRQAERIKAAIRHTYPQMGEIAIEQAWSGTMGFAVHRMPQIGEISPGIWVANGFAGHGINTTAMAGSFGRAAIQMSAWARRSLERVRSQRARKSAVSPRTIRNGASAG